MKSMWFFFFFLFFSCSCLAQHNIRGRLFDEQNQPLSYATVALLQPGDSLLQHFGVTNLQGEYQIKGIKEGIYIIQFSYVGLETDYDQIEIPLSTGEELVDRQLRATIMEEVIVEAELIPVRFKNDTLEFDVRAFKTRSGAAVEEVLRQLPGVEVDNSGNIKAEGEEVVRVLVDGKEFFNEDPKVATKNLPAKALSKVQVIDRKTEEALFSGIDDGIREKTINLELKEDHKKGYFGEVEAGIGTDETYRLVGRVYRFSEKTQNAVLGLYNNINEFGFTNKDNNQFGENNRGVNEALAGGLNLSYNPTSQNRYFLSYLGNRREKDLIEQIHTENFLSSVTYQQDQEILESDTDRPHKVNFGVRHSFNPKKRLVFDGVVNLNNSDIFTENFTLSQTPEQLINTFDNETINASDDLSVWAQATYIAKFNSDKTQFKSEVQGVFNNNLNRLDLINETRFFEPVNEVLRQQFQTNDQDRLSFYVDPSFLQNLNTKWSLSLGARFEMDDRSLIRKEGVLNDQSEFEETEIPNFVTRQRMVRPTLILNRVGEKSQFNISLASVVNQFDKVLNANSFQKENYFFWTPTINYQNEYRSGRRINLRYSADVTMPSVEQLIPIDNAVNQLNIIRGNLDLVPEQRHQVYANWTLFDQFSFTSVSFRFGGTYTQDKIRWAQTIGEDLVKVSRPANIDNDYSLYTYLDFSTPVRSLGLNLNVTSTENWNRSIVFINGEENINTNFSHNLDLALENRKNDVLAVRLSAAINLTDSRFSIAEDQNNIFFNTSYTANLRYSPGKKWNFEARANIVNYNAQSFEEAVSIPLISANASYFFLQAEKASLTLSIFDLLNEYQGIQRIGDTNFLLQREWNTLTQYFMLTFTLRFR